MKLLLKISDNQSKRIQSATGEACRTAITNFITEAIEAHLQGKERMFNGQCEADLTTLVEQVRELRKGQRAIAAIVDSSATAVVMILRGFSRSQTDR